ncbi:MAG: hypothetical protein QM749_00390 [Aquabacterium sp.]
MNQHTNDEAQALYAIVELFGHQKIAGHISEQTFGGQAMVRVDVPEVTYEEYDYSTGERRSVSKTIQAHTRSFGPGADLFHQLVRFHGRCPGRPADPTQARRALQRG